MKLQIKIATVLIIVTLLTAGSTSVFASDPPPPPPGHGEIGNVPGGGAPIGSGIALLLALGGAYAVKKWKNTNE